jgi:hypothetical protein
MGKDMPRFKVLKGVAHNVEHSLTSLMNYAVDDYSMGHILRFARETGDATLTIDFVTGHALPETLLREPISKLPDWYTKMFWDLVQSSGSDRDLVQAAKLTLTYELQRSRRGRLANSIESPYTCDVSIHDVRGRDYRAHFEGWWDIGGRLDPSLLVRWWNPFGWFRSIRELFSGARS